MNEKPKLVIAPWVRGEPIAYACSLCGQTFLVPEDQSPKEGMAELWQAFRDHVREKHLSADEDETSGDGP